MAGRSFASVGNIRNTSTNPGFIPQWNGRDHRAAGIFPAAQVRRKAHFAGVFAQDCEKIVEAARVEPTSTFTTKPTSNRTQSRKVPISIRILDSRSDLGKEQNPRRCVLYPCGQRLAFLASITRRCNNRVVPPLTRVLSIHLMKCPPNYL